MDPQMVKVLEALRREGGEADALHLAEVYLEQNRGVAGKALLGHVIRRLGRIDEARDLLLDAVADDPSCLTALRDLAEIGFTLGDIRSAHDYALRATEVAPRDGYANVLLGVAHAAVQDFDSATAVWGTDLELDPKRIELIVRLVHRLRLRNFEAALAIAQLLHRLVPENLVVLRACVRLLDSAEAGTGRQAELIATLEQLAEAGKPWDVAQLAILLMRSSRIRKAHDAVTGGLKRFPEDVCLRLLDLVVATHGVDRNERDRVGRVEHWDRALAAVLETRAREASVEELPLAVRELGLMLPTNLLLSYCGADMTERQVNYAGVIEAIARPLLEPYVFDGRRRRSRACIRVGVVSAFMRFHAVTRLFGHVITQLERRGGFEVVIFALEGPFDAWSRRISGSVSEWVEGRRSLAEWAKTIRQSDCDLLIYPDVVLHPRAQALASVRLAPRQMHLWHTHTSGFCTFDAALVPEKMRSPTEAAQWTEPLSDLPGIGAYFVPQDVPWRWPVRDSPGAERLELMCLQHGLKLLPSQDAAYVEILAQAPAKTRMTFFPNLPQEEASIFEERFRRACDIAGVSHDRRVRVLPVLDPQTYAHEVAEAHLVVDTFSYSGGTTSLDALALGIPVLALAGDSLRNRQTEAMLELLDLHSLVAETRSEFVSNAVRILHDADERRELESTIRDRVGTLFHDSRVLTAVVHAIAGLTETPV